MMRIRLMAVLLLATSVATVRAQLTYVGFGTGYSRTKFAGSGSHRFSQNMGTFSFSAMHRPLRFLAVGGSIVLPYSENYSGTYWRTTTTDGNSFSMSYWDTGFAPQIMTGTLDQSATLRGILRFFAEGSGNAYLEASISSFKLTERATFRRYESQVEIYDGNNFYYETVEGVDLSYRNEERVTAFGLRLGAMPHFGKNLYADFSLGWSFPRFSGKGFTSFFNYEYDGLSYRMNYLMLSSPVPGSKTTLSIDAGFGVCF